MMKGTTNMKKSLKKLLGTLLTLVMLTSLLNVTVFAAAPDHAYLKVSDANYTSLAVNSEVTATVSLMGLKDGQYLAGFYAHLADTEYLKVKSVSFASAISGWSGGYNTTTKDVNKVSLEAAADSGKGISANGTELFTVTYTVLKDIPMGTAVNPSITGVTMNKTSEVFLNSATGSTPTAAEKAASVVYPEKGFIFVSELIPQGYTVTVTATPSAVYMDQTVTVKVTVTGAQFTGAYYKLKYETDKFALVDSPDAASEVTTGTFKHIYLGYNSADGTVIGEYTFKALAQDTEVTGYFELDEYATVCSNGEALQGDDVAATISDAAPVTIKLIPADSTDPEGLTVSADDVEKEYDGNAYGVTATANKADATIRYQDADGNYTLTESPKYSAVGEYTVNFKATLKGYADAFGSAKVKITAPKYFTETTEYVAGYSLVLVYTDVDGLNFTYNSRTMYDVTNAGYSLSGTAYSHVYGIVVKGNADMTKLAYATGTATKIGYTTDVNASGKTDLKDAVNTVAVYNADAEYMTDAQMMLVLRADVNHDKKVDNSDTNLVLKAF